MDVAETSHVGTIARRLSIHRATTVGPKSPLCQVILKNTSVMKEVSMPFTNSPINRSQSLLTTNARIPILAPHRGERARLEALLSDVYSREILPFPGMTGRARSEQLVRASASSMIRKLSVASITSSFTKRSGSMASMTKPTPIDDEPLNTVDGDVRLLKKLEDKDIMTGVAGQEMEKSHIRLPIIQDEWEKNSSGSASLKAGPDQGGKASPTRYTAKTQPSTEAQKHEFDDIEITVLQTSSANSSYLREHQSSSSNNISPCISDKENIRRQAKRTLRKPKNRGPSRWAKVGAGVLNRDIMVQGIRNIFR
jgi:hypothetical protein